MFDESFRARFAGWVKPLAPPLARLGVTANHVTIVSFLLTLVAAALIADGRSFAGLARGAGRLRSRHHDDARPFGCRPACGPRRQAHQSHVPVHAGPDGSRRDERHVRGVGGVSPAAAVARVGLGRRARDHDCATDGAGVASAALTAVSNGKPRTRGSETSPGSRNPRTPTATSPAAASKRAVRWSRSQTARPLEKFDCSCAGFTE